MVPVFWHDAFEGCSCRRGGVEAAPKVTSCRSNYEKRAFASEPCPPKVDVIPAELRAKSRVSSMQEA